MCTFERYTERRGRVAVPATLRLTRLRRFSLCIRFSRTAMKILLLAGLADLAPDLLVAVADALALIRLGRPDPPDFRRHLADPLFVYAAHDDRRRVGHLELYALARGYRDQMGVPYLQVDFLPLQRASVPDALYYERLGKTVRNARDGVLDQAP